MPSDYIYTNEGLVPVNDLMHYGVPGMKWGVRRYLNANGTFNNKGIKKYDKKQHAKESADIRESSSTKKQNEDAAKKYISDKKQFKKDVKAYREARKYIDFNISSSGEISNVRNRGNELIYKLTKEKGGPYVDKILKHEQRRAKATTISAIAGTSAVVIGASFISAVLS